MTTKHPSTTPGIASPRRIAVLLTNNDETEFSQFPNDGDKVSAFLQGHRASWHYDIYLVMGAGRSSQSHSSRFALKSPLGLTLTSVTVDTVLSAIR